MAVLMLNGPTIPAGESLSTAIDCAQGVPVAIAIPTTWVSAVCTFQISGDGEFFGDLFDLMANEITVNLEPGTVVRLDPEKNRGAAFIKLRSGSRATPVVQHEQQDFKIFIDRAVSPMGLNEAAYVEAINDVTIEGARKALITAPSVTFDGTMACYVEFYSSGLEVGANTTAKLSLSGGGGLEFGEITSAVGGPNMIITQPTRIMRRLVPPSGPHAFSVSGQRTVGTSNVTMRAGGGGADQHMPAFLRVLTITQ